MVERGGWLSKQRGTRIGQRAENRHPGSARGSREGSASATALCFVVENTGGLTTIRTKLNLIANLSNQAGPSHSSAGVVDAFRARADHCDRKVVENAEDAAVMPSITCST